ncbi:MAG: hypothetical protein J6P19_04625 [Acetobacter sp.]|nr:hypothetical protein [Acetobacter sp.]
MTSEEPFATVTIDPHETSIIGHLDLQTTQFELLVKAEDLKDVLSHGHTARVPLVYILRDLLNYRDNKKSWTVEIKDNGALVLSNRSEKYLFHAVKNKEEIEREIKKYQDLNILHHFFAVLEQFKTSRVVNFYYCAEIAKYTFGYLLGNNLH